MEKVVYAFPTWSPVAPKVVRRYLLIWPYHAPQEKNIKNIMAMSWNFTVLFIIIGFVRDQKYKFA
jgi:hypothetical protein